MAVAVLGLGAWREEVWYSEARSHQFSGKRNGRVFDTTAYKQVGVQEEG